MVEILKAISRGAKLLVMDEPTSSLTIREEETLFSTIDQLKAAGIGIVYISHRMADVLRLSDRISIVKDGRIVGPLLPHETSIDHIAALMSRPKDDDVEAPVGATDAARAYGRVGRPAGTRGSRPVDGPQALGHLVLDRSWARSSASLASSAVAARR